jgi:phenylacetate-CoA ligase
LRRRQAGGIALNVDWLSRLPGPVRAALYFGLQQAIGSRIFSKWKELQAWQRFSSSQLEAAIESRLSRLLATAAGQSAYYRGFGLARASGENGRDFLKRFPILTREQLRAHFAELVIDPLRGEIQSTKSVSARKYDWLVVKTGGTTGVPTTVVHDASFRDWGRATRLLTQKMCGFPLGTRYFRLWGSEQDLLQQREKLDRRVLRNLLGEIPMNAFRAKEAELAQHLRTMHGHLDIRHLMAYVDAAVSLAAFLEDRKLPKPQLKTIMACAGTVTPEWRAVLQRTFQAEVFDKYGSRECAEIACECSSHAGLHVISPNVYVEVVDDTGEPCPPGQTGRLLITLLNNLSFPMIRYQIGDLGVWAEPGSCPCGLAFPRLQSLQGREDDMLTTEDGTLLSSVFIRHFVGVSLNRQLIREWQFEQMERNAFIFRYIPLQTDGLDSNLRQLHFSFQTALGKSAAIQMQPVTEIPPSPTGKTLWILNRSKRKLA